MRTLSLALSALALVLTCSTSEGALITYVGQLQNGVPVNGVNNQAPSNSDNPVGAVYYSFYATAGSVVTVTGDRLAGHYDMAFWVFSGLFNDTNDFGGAFDSSDAGFIDFGDDEQPPNIAGPFGDPQSVFNAPVTGFYTVAVTNFLSSAGPPNPFQLQATGIDNVVPEPGTLAMFGTLVGIGLCACRRRRQAAAAA
jgi:hypothetical protein